jgi:hypothetical protein
VISTPAVRFLRLCYARKVKVLVCLKEERKLKDSSQKFLFVPGKMMKNEDIEESSIMIVGTYN